MNAAADNNAEKEIIKKFQFVSKDRTESFEILIAELLVGKNMRSFVIEYYS